MPAAVHALGVLWMEPAAVLCAGSASCQLLVTSRHAAACTHLLARQLLTTPLPACCYPCPCLCLLQAHACEGVWAARDDA